ncbi:MAG: basic amino acid ABC transporter substrate-binding protein [Ruminococcaceae bacterium]|nr:basic amino acid ABC transporter substrate-binding protein [Oscillospiraceae bacterium]
MKKIISLIMVVAIMLCMFVGCGKTEQDNVITMATSADFEPYEYYENDKIVGIDIDIMNAVCEKIGMQLQPEDMSFDSVIGAAQTGKADIAMSGITITEDRKNMVDFTIPYTSTTQSIIVAHGSAITVKADLKDKKIGVQINTTGDTQVTEEFGDAAVDRYQNGALAVESLKNGKVDCVVIDGEVAKALVDANEGLEIIADAYSIEEYAIALQKGNTELLNKINGALEELLADGTIDEIIAKYITE